MGMLQKIVQVIEDHGGRAYLVGGAVLDLQDGREPKDWDIEVFDMSYQSLAGVVRVFGPADLIGQKFGVIKQNLDGLDVEWAIPRRENKVGPKHADFDIELVPDLSIREAARRRDFTINAVYMDLFTEEVTDPFNGLHHYRQGRLTYVSRDTFVDDPLRVFRAAQISARKNVFASAPLFLLCQDMVEECRHLSGDAIFGELTKLLMLSDNPSRGWQFINHTGLIALFPELEVLVCCPQDEKHHPEGDVFTHTLLTLDEAAKCRDELPEEWQLPFMFGMLLHDVGKPATLDLEVLTTYGHDKEGMEPAATFMRRLTNNESLIEKVVSIVRCHMRPWQLIKANKARMGAWRRLHNICPLNVIAYVSMCDAKGRGVDFPDRQEKSFTVTMDTFKKLGEPPSGIPAVLMGRHLIKAGYKPGPEFGKMLKAAYEYQLDNGTEDVEELLAVAVGGKNDA